MTASKADFGVYAHLNTLATTTIKTGQGVLKRITLNTKGAGSSMTIYDSLSGAGTVIGVFDTSSTITYWDFEECIVSLGITIVIAGGTAPDLTVIYS